MQVSEEIRLTEPRRRDAYHLITVQKQYNFISLNPTIKVIHILTINIG